MFSGDEHPGILNERDQVSVLSSLLERLGLQSTVHPEPLDNRGADAIVQVRTPSGAARAYAIQVKRNVPTELASALHVHPTLPTLVVARSITEMAAELLRDRGVDYLDEAGNAHMAWDDVLIDIRGRRKALARKSGPSPRGSKAFGRAGLRVGFVLLSWPHLAAEPLRRIASAGRASLGTTKMVIDELSKAGYLYHAAGERRLARAGELLNRWSEAYSIALSPGLAIGDFSVADVSWWRRSEEELLAANVQVGGEAGASRIDPHLTPTTLTLYADELPGALIRRHRLARAEQDGNIQVRQRFWEMPEETWIVPSTLIYADLLASGDPRQREHADRIRISDDRLAALDRL